MATASDISERIMEAVMGQKLAPGSRLGEQQLAMLFDCSRTIVREALTRLAARGIVPGRNVMTSRAAIHRCNIGVSLEQSVTEYGRAGRAGKRGRCARPRRNRSWTEALSAHG